MAKHKKSENKLKDWVPTAEQEERQTFVYTALREMHDVMVQSYAEFNDRTLVQFIDDSQKRLNSYVMDRDAQGKEAHLANVFTPFTRNKLKAMVANVAKDVPKIAINAVNEANQLSFKRAEVMKNLLHASYVERGNNPEKISFFDAWNCSGNGTVIKYDGYLRTKQKRKIIESFDQIDGKVKWKEEEMEVESRAIEKDIPLNRFYIRNPYIADIQEQPDVIWLELYDEDTFDIEFGNYKNADAVPSFAGLSTDEIATFYGENMFDGDVTRRKIVLRYYNKARDEFSIWANGVELLYAPLLWGRKKKYYPFAKTVFEPFAKSNFFWGNSLPNILMSEQDVANSFLNAMIDKTHRSLQTPMLIDVQNRDAFQLEDEYVTGDTKIYVNNINGVKPMPIDSVSQAEFSMLETVLRGLDMAGGDAVQGGVAGSGSTAREIVIANERADEVKGLFFVMLKDLWLQKYILRIENILLHYATNMKKVERLVGKEKKKVFQNQFNLPNATLSDGVIGEMQMVAVKGKENLPSEGEIDIEEEMARLQGKRIEKVYFASDYLDEWEYDLEVQTESLRTKQRALDMALAAEKLQAVQAFFPEIFAANKEEFFRDFMKRFNDDPERYLATAEKTAGQQEQLQQPASQPQGGGIGEILSQIGGPSMQSLPQLTGAQV